MAWAFIVIAYLITAVAYFSILWRTQRTAALTADLSSTRLREAACSRRS